MQYVVKGGFGTVEEAVRVERNESVLAYCALLQLQYLVSHNLELRRVGGRACLGSLWRGRAPEWLD